MSSYFAAPPQREPKYIFIGFFIHGGYGLASRPYKVNEHASISIQPFYSTPKLMTILNCAPGNVLIGEDDGNDNTKLTNYFRTNSQIDITDTANQTTNKDQDQKIAENFLNYVKSGLATLRLNPRVNIEKYSIENPTDIDVCRNSYICNNKVGISHTFLNKSFSTEKPPIGISPEDWGIFIYNNNCGIPFGTNIESIYGIRPYDVINKDGEVIGIKFDLNNIISYLTYRYELTDKDYLFLFDYTCNIFAKTVEPLKNERTIRDLGNNVFKTLGFRAGKKRSKKGFKKHSKKRTQKLKKIKHPIR